MRYSKPHHPLVVVAFFLVNALLCTAQQPAIISQAKASYVTFQVPGALGTYPTAINNVAAASSSIFAEITGYYLTSPTTANAFVRYANGVMFTFSAEGAVWTVPESMDAAGNITGFYETAAGVPHGFVREAQYGSIIPFDTPFDEPAPQTLPIGINDYGEIAGNFLSTSNSSQGFARSTIGAAVHGVFTRFNYGPGVDPPTFVTGLNGSGTIVGYFPNSGDTKESSFINHPDGYQTQFDVPPNQDMPCVQTTRAESINAGGTIVGFYSGYANTGNSICASKVAGGFIRSPQGAFTLFNTQGPMVMIPSPALPDIGPTIFAPARLSINQGGIIIGSYTDFGQNQHGFVREADGTITSFDPPGGAQTTATGIDDSGLIIGSYFDQANPQVAVGFLRTPIP